jgi:competence protein ComEC
LLLLYEPLYLFSIGFQLSFGTVFGLVLLTGPTERALAMLGIKKFRRLLAYNIVASVSTYPILAYHFSYIAVYSIIVNLIVAPTLVILVLIGLLTGLAGLFFSGAALFLAGAVYYILQFYEGVVRTFLSLPGAVWLTGNWGLFVTFASLAVMLAFGYAFSGYGENFRKRKQILYAAVVVLLVCVGFEAADRRRFNITVLDTGSYVLREGSRTFVIDGGGNNRLLGLNTGATVLMPYLDYRGAAKADAAFVTDASRERITGLIELAMADRVKVLYVPARLEMETGLGARLRAAADRNGIPIYRLNENDIVQSGGLAVEVVSTEPRMLLEVIR